MITGVDPPYDPLQVIPNIHKIAHFVKANKDLADYVVNYTL